jgi:hypothetical protein
MYVSLAGCLFLFSMPVIPGCRYQLIASFLDLVASFFLFSLACRAYSLFLFVGSWYVLTAGNSCIFRSSEDVRTLMLGFIEDVV